MLMISIGVKYIGIELLVIRQVEQCMDISYLSIVP